MTELASRILGTTQAFGRLDAGMVEAGRSANTAAASLARTDRALAATGASATDLAFAAQSAAAATKALDGAQNAATGSSSRLRAAQLQLTAATERSVAVSRSWSASTEQVARSQATLIRAEASVVAASRDAEKATAGLTAAQLRQVAAQERVDALMADGTASAGRLAAAQASLVRANEAVAAAQLKVRDASLSTDAALGTGGAAARWRSVMGVIDAIPGPAKAAALAVTAIATAGTAAASKFDAKMALVQSLSKATAGEMNRLRDAALHVGQRFGYTADQVADAQAELVKAGVSVRDILGGALTGALTLAAAGQMDVAQATEIATTAMTQFHLAGQDVPHIADLLAAGADKALGSVGQLGEALEYGGLASSQAGESIENTIGTLAEFAQAGLRGSSAGAALSMMLQNLQKPSAQAAAVMKQYGISLYNANGTTKSYTQLAGNLHDSLANLPQAERSAAIATLFTSRARRAATILTLDGADANRQWTKTVNDQGFAAGQASGKLNSLRGDLQKLGAAGETALINIGEKAQVPLRQLVGWLAGPALRGVQSFWHGLSSNTMILGALHDIEGAVKDIAQVFGNAWHAAEPFISGVGRLALDGALLGVHLLAAALHGLTSALSEVSGFLARNRLALAAAATALIAVYGKGVMYAVSTTGRFIALPLLAWASEAAAAVKALGASFTLAGREAAASEALMAQGLFVSGEIETTALASAGALGKLQAAGSGLMAVLGGLATKAGPAAVLTSLAAVAITVADGFGKADRDAKKFEDSIAGLTDPKKASGLQNYVANMKKAIGDLNKEADHWMQRSQTDNPWDMVMHSGEWSDKALDLGAKANQLGQNLQAVQRNVTALSQTFRISQDDAFNLAAAAGGKLGGDLDQLKSKVAAYIVAGAGASATSQTLENNLTEMAGGAETAAQRTQDLNNTLNALIGNKVSTQQALDQLSQSLLDYSKGLDQNGTSFSRNTEKGLTNRRNLEGVATAIQGVINKLGENGASYQTIQRKVAAAITTWEHENKVHGLTTEQIKALAHQVGITPKQLRVAIQAYGGVATKKQIDGVAQSMDGVNNLSPLQIAMQLRGLTNDMDQLQTFKATLESINGYTAYTHVVVKTDAGHSVQLPIPRHAAGGLIRGPGGPTDDLVPILASNREFIVNAAQAERHLPLLEAINAGRFAAGGQVGGGGGGNRHGGGASPAHLLAAVAALAGSLGHGATSGQIGNTLTAIQNLLDAFNAATQRLSDAAQRRDLVQALNKATREYDRAKPKDKASARSQLDDARKALRQFDQQQAQSRATDRVAKRQAALQARQNLQANREAWAFENMSEAQQVAYLTKKMAAEKKYSDQWLSAAEQRKQIEDDLGKSADKSAAALAKIAANKKQWVFDHETAAQQLADLQAQAAGLQHYSDAWMNVESQIDSVKQALQQAASDALSTLNDLLSQASQIRGEEAQALTDFNSAVADAQATYRSTVAQIVNDRTTAILSYAKITDAAQQATTSLFTITSTDQTGAENLLQHLGLLTDAMQAYNDQGQTATLTAAQIISNAQAQTASIISWSQGLAQLRQMGLTDASIQALGLDQDPSALGEVQALLSATSDQIAQLNQSVIDRTAAASSEVAAEQTGMFGQVGQQLIAAQQTLNDALDSAQSDYLAKMKDYDQQLAALGQQTGLDFADAIAAGIASGIPGIIAAATAAAQAAAAAAGGNPAAANTIAANAQTVTQASITAAVAAASGRLPASLAPGHTLTGGGTIPLLVRDAGGLLPPGLSMVANATGQDEYVHTREQMAALMSGRSGGSAAPAPVITFNVDARGAVEGTARQISDALEGFAGRLGMHFATRAGTRP